MSLNVIDCTYNTYSLPSVSFLQAHSNNAVLRMNRPITEVYNYILGLLKNGVYVIIRVVKKDMCDPTVITSASDLKAVFEILNTTPNKEVM